MLSDKTIQCLIRAGWTPERRVDISEWVTKLDHVGITLSPTAHEFMSCYAGLDIRVPYDINGECWEDKIQIALLDPTFEPRAAYTKDVQEETDISVFVIGYSGHVKLLMSPDGSIFEDTEDYIIHFTHLTDNVDDIIEEFLSKHLPIELFDEVKNRWMSWDEHLIL